MPVYLPACCGEIVITTNGVVGRVHHRSWPDWPPDKNIWPKTTGPGAANWIPKPPTRRLGLYDTVGHTPIHVVFAGSWPRQPHEIRCWPQRLHRSTSQSLRCCWPLPHPQSGHLFSFCSRSMARCHSSLLSNSSVINIVEILSLVLFLRKV